MKFFKKTDIIVVIAIVLLSISFWLTYNYCFADKPAKAEIYYDSTLVQTVDLTKGVEKTFSIPQNEHVVFHLFKDGSICFEQSNCPDQICVHTGKIHTVRQYAACLPNRIILKIVSENNQENSPDIIVGK